MMLKFQNFLLTKMPQSILAQYKSVLLGQHVAARPMAQRFY